MFDLVVVAVQAVVATGLIQARPPASVPVPVSVCLRIPCPCIPSPRPYPCPPVPPLSLGVSAPPRGIVWLQRCGRLPAPVPCVRFRAHGRAFSVGLGRLPAGLSWGSVAGAHTRERARHGLHAPAGARARTHTHTHTHTHTTYHTRAPTRNAQVRARARTHTHTHR